MTNRKPFTITPNADTAPRIEKPYTYITLNHDHTITLSDDVADTTITTTNNIVRLATGNRPLKTCFFNGDALPTAPKAHEFLDTYGEKTGGDETTTFYLFNGYEYAVLADNTVMTIAEYNSIANADVADTQSDGTPPIPKLLKKVQSTLIDRLNEFEELNICDICHFIFSTYPVYVYTAAAVSDIAELGVWQVLDVVKEYEQTYSDECNTDLSDPVKVANTLVYIVGEALLNELFANTKYFDEYWGVMADKKMLQEMLSLATVKFKLNPNLVLDAWYECIKPTVNLP